ncbi:MAG: hypothetical protein FIA96_08735 [Betaproteobacteria bacterium]|nr:hypothetical protein [Betaproteobacteria bacterium]
MNKPVDLEVLQKSACTDMAYRFEAYRRDLPFTLKEALSLQHKVKDWRFIAPGFMGARLHDGTRAIWDGRFLNVWPDWSKEPYRVIENQAVEDIPERPAVLKPDPDQPEREELPNDDIRGKCGLIEEDEYIPPREPGSLLEILFNQAEKAGVFGRKVVPIK